MKFLSSKIFLLSLTLLFAVHSFGQKEAYIWYFGQNVGLDFNTSPPTPLTDGVIVTQEGVATIADKFGSLLFYTDGKTIWNKVHSTMLGGTGMLGDASSAQSGIIVPQPGNDSIYYMISVSGHTSGRRGYYYNVVNMRRDGGKGEVITKNVPMLNPTMSGPECIGATLHSNKRDIWVLLKKHSTDSFYSFLVTPTGISSTPVKSAAGPVISSNYYMKFSPIGDKFAITHSWVPWLMDFDQSTGMVTGGFEVASGLSTYNPAWSPDSRMLYLGRSNVTQYDVMAGTIADIRASATIVGSGGSGSARYARQLGPDGKIYIANYLTKTMDVIHEPNEKGALCDYRVNDITLLGTGQCRIGLPTFIQSFFNPVNFTYENICLGDTTFFYVTGDTGVFDSVKWYFDDPSSGPNDSAVGFSTWHIFTDTGTYNVCAVSYDTSGFIDTSCIPIQILTDPIIGLPADTILCSGENWEIAPTFSSEFAWMWSDSSTDSSFTIDAPGTYWVQSQNPCGLARDTIIVEFHSPLSPDLGADLDLCDGETRGLSVGGGPEVTYLWSTGDTSNAITVSGPGTYFVEMSNACGTFADSIEVTYTSPPTANLPLQDTIVCFGDDLILNSGNPDADVTWPDGSTGSTFVVNGPGTYWLRVDNFCGSDVDSLYVDFDNCCAIGIPNAFSPNQDGLNDEFSLIRDYCAVSNFELTIYNRLGQVVFESTDPDEKWDGTKNGKDLELGVYVYKMRYTLDVPDKNGIIPQGQEQLVSGNVTLIR